MGRGNPQEVEGQGPGATLQCMGDSAKTTPVHNESLVACECETGF